ADADHGNRPGSGTGRHRAAGGSCPYRLGAAAEMAPERFDPSFLPTRLGMFIGGREVHLRSCRLPINPCIIWDLLHELGDDGCTTLGFRLVPHPHRFPRECGVSQITQTRYGSPSSSCLTTCSATMRSWRSDRVSGGGGNAGLCSVVRTGRLGMKAVRSG